MEKCFNIYKNWCALSTDKRLQLPAVLDLIKSGGDNLPMFNEIRSIDKGEPKYDLIKSNLPLVAWNVFFNDGKTNADIKATTGYLYFDKDGLEDGEIEGYKEQLMTFKFVVAVWKSVGGLGLGCLIRVENVTQDNHKEVWHEIADAIGIGFDQVASKIGQLNIISYDPDIRINETPEPYVYTDNVSISTRNISYASNESSYRYATVSTSTPAIDYSGTTSYSQQKVQFTTNKGEHSIYGYNAPCEDEKGNFLLTFKTKLDDSVFGDKEYAVFEDGIEFVQVYCPRRIPEGKRNNTLVSIASVLVYLNPIELRNDVMRMVEYFNKTKCISPLPKHELSKIINYTYEKKKKSELYVKPKTRYIVFKLGTKLTVKQKLSITGTETGRIRRLRTEKDILEAVKQLKLVKEIVRQIDVAGHIGVSIRTVKKYWSGVKYNL